MLVAFGSGAYRVNMSRIDQITGDWEAALAALAWQVDLGIDTVVQDAPVNRYHAAEPIPDAAPPILRHAQAPTSPDAPPAADTMAEAEASAAGATSLAALHAALAAWPHCEIRRGARNLVFAGGTAGARVMVVGEAPDVDEDRSGIPFAGVKGALLDRMFAAIGLARDAKDPARGVYLTTALPWRSVGPPREGDVAMLRPFVLRHIALAQPEIVVAMGNDAVSTLLQGAVDPPARGAWRVVLDRPLLVMQHPGHLLRNPVAKGAAWADLVALKARLREGSCA